MCIVKDGATLGRRKDQLMMSLCLLSLEVFVVHKEVPCLLDNTFTLVEGDIGKAGRVGKKVLNVHELFFACRVIGDRSIGVAVAAGVDSVGGVSSISSINSPVAVAVGLALSKYGSCYSKGRRQSRRYII